MKPARFSLVFLLSACLAPLGAQSIGGCPTFPANNIWNTPVDTLPLSPRSADYINSAGPSTRLHADFGSGLWEGGPIGIPYVIVNGAQPKKPVTFDYADESDPGPYPVPDNPPIEGGPDSDGDRHILIVDSTNCILYELYAAYPRSNGSWEAGSGAIYSLTGNQLRPRGWTSADAAGLAILPGLVRYEEAVSGEIRHAIRFTVSRTQRAYVWPARHYASSNTSPTVPPMGQRFRLKAGFDVSGFSPIVRTILNAMKKYGVILADNGSNWFISGAPDERWNNDDLATLRNVRGSDFEAVDISSLMIDQDSAQAVQPDGTTLAAVTLERASVIGGQTTTGNAVSLAGAAPNGGAMVVLTSSNPGVAGVPPTVVIPAGSASAAFSVATTPVAARTAVTIGAAYNGVTKTAALTVTPDSLIGFSISPSSVNGGASATGTLTLAAPAPAAAVVALSSNSSAAVPPAAVTIAAGASSATFPIATTAVSAAVQATLSAAYAGTTLTASLRVNPAPTSLTLTLLSSPVTGGVRALARVTLAAAAASPVTIALSSSNSAVAQAPASVSIPAGAASTTFSIRTRPVAAATDVALSASLSGATSSATLRVLPAVLRAVWTPYAIRTGATATGRVSLTGAAAAPYTISLASSNPSAIAVPATVTIPAGALSASFPIRAGSVLGAVQITAAHNGVAVRTTITVSDANNPPRSLTHR